VPPESPELTRVDLVRNAAPLGLEGVGPRLAIRGARILPSPDAAPIERGTIVVDRGRIVAAGTDVTVPSTAQVIPGEGTTVTAGFWNCHVHFTEAKWGSARRKPASVLEGHLREMCSSRGFTTVVDVGSDPRTTLALRRRVESGEILGPAIHTAGPGVYPPHAIPYYLRESLPLWVRPFLPQPSTPSSASRLTERNLARGADVVKLFTGSYVERDEVAVMPEAIARAVVGVAHAHGLLAYSHPSNAEGARVAIRSGVDILAHPPDTTEGVDETLVREMVGRRMAMIPTLKMFETTVSSSERYLGPIYAVVRGFHEAGGQLLFGTDVGYMREYGTEEEFRGLSRCGLDPREVLRMLTAAPAARFGVGTEVGSIEVGRRADLVLLDSNPMDDILAFSRVRATVRAGRVVYVRS